jgi:hypothetical protein
MRKLTTRDLSDKHEEFLADLLGGRCTRGSGNQFNDQMDGRNAVGTPFGLAWDGKATLGKGVTVTQEMWQKAREQAGAETPALALRWYASERLDPALDLMVLDVHDFTALLEAARAFSAVKSCLEEGHEIPGWPDDPGPICSRCGHRTGYLGAE